MNKRQKFRVKREIVAEENSDRQYFLPGFSTPSPAYLPFLFLDLKFEVYLFSRAVELSYWSEDGPY